MFIYFLKCIKECIINMAILWTIKDCLIELLIDISIIQSRQHAHGFTKLIAISSIIFLQPNIAASYFNNQTVFLIRKVFFLSDTCRHFINSSFKIFQLTICKSNGLFQLFNSLFITFFCVSLRLRLIKFFPLFSIIFTRVCY